ncbi:MAG: OB-fold nucleic acid binding domain-containing protein, partial [Thermodesulfobacteriota bacterium]
MGDWRRDLYCGEVSTDNTGTTLTVMGWVQRRRDHGGLIFVDLRDRTGVVQVVFNPEESREIHDRAHSLR